MRRFSLFFTLFLTALAQAQTAPNPETYFKASNPGANARLGRSIAIDGDTLVIGAPGEGSNGSDPANSSMPDAGAVYVFIRQNDTWVQQARLKPAEPSTGDQFGGAVAIDGDTLVIGARGNDSNSPVFPTWGGARDSGAAYVFVRNGSTWTEQAYIKAFIPNGGIEDMAIGDAFGAWVDIDGTTIAIAAPNEDDIAIESGAVYIYTWTGTEWFGQQRVKAPAPATADNFGPLALDGETLVVGSPDRSSDSGEAYVFVRDENTWTLRATLNAPNAGAGDAFGEVVAINGNTIAIAAPLEDGSATGIGGASNNSAKDSGAVYLFTGSGATWSPGVYVKASNTAAGDQFGSSLALDRDFLLVGAAFEDSAAIGIEGNQADNSASDSGAAYLFTRGTSTWLQRAYLKASNTGAGDGFGGPGGVAACGSLLAIGAIHEDSSTAGVGGNGTLNNLSDAGAAYLYRSAPTHFAPVFHTASDKAWSAADPLPAMRTLSPITLDFEPIPGTSLTLVEKTNLGFMQGSFPDLVQGQKVTLSHAGQRYNFIANYYGGDGNDLVLQWAGLLPRSWGNQHFDPQDFSLPFKKIVIGGNHMLGLRDDGSVAAWGLNSYGQAEVPEEVAGVRDIAAGVFHSIAIREDGTVLRWGNFNAWAGNGAMPPEDLNDVTQIATGWEHGLALKSDGTVVTWGRNHQDKPNDLSGVTAIAAGHYFSMALKANGTVLSWPGNPVPVGLTGVTAVAAGQSHSLALKSDGTVVSWGTSFPELASVPVGLSGVVAIAAGDAHSVALKGDGTVIAWGSNDRSQLLIPAGAVDITAIAAAGTHTVAMKRDGTIFVWGRGNEFDRGPCKFTLMSPDRLRDLAAISAGNDHNLGLTYRGEVGHWGNSDYRLSGIPIKATNVAAIAAGENHSTALTRAGSVLVWGMDEPGQYQGWVPVGLKACNIAAGGTESMALTGDGTLADWSSSGATYRSGFRKIAIGKSTLVALRHDGSTWEPGVTTVPTGLTDVSFLAAGDGQRLALKNDGSVVAWGSNESGKATVPEDLSGVIAIAAGRSHSLALKNDHTLTIWGGNDRGQASVPEDISGVAAIAGGTTHSTALVAVKPFLGRMGISDFSDSRVTIHGETNPNGQPATLLVQYGEESTYGHSEPLPLDPASDDGQTSVTGSMVLTGLQPSKTYHYRLLATNHSGTTYGPDLTFTPLGSREFWRLQHFGHTTESGETADDADPDHDGLANLLEAACNLDPLQPGLPILGAEATSTTGLPRVTRSGTGDSSRLRIEFIRRRASTLPEMTWVAQFSSLSADWTSVAAPETVFAIDDTWERVTVEDPAPETFPVRFARIKVTTP